MKCNNIDIIGIWGEESEQKMESLFEEIVAENIPNLMKDKVNQLQEESPKQDEPKEAHAKTHHN